MSIWLPVLAVVAAMAVWTLLHPDPVRLSRRALRTGEYGPLYAALQRVPVASQPTQYHRVIRSMWYGYHREEAVEIAKDLARRHRKAPVAQYWLKQFMESEPKIAKEHFDDGFLAEFHDPCVAAKCGSCGCH